MLKKVVLRSFHQDVCKVVYKFVHKLAFIFRSSTIGIASSFNFLFAFSILLPSTLLAETGKVEPKKPAKVVLALNWKAEPQFGGFYAAALNGEFKKRNLEVQILEGGSGTPTAQMLASGKVDFGIVSAEEILVARERGGELLGLFAAFQTNPQAIMTRADRNLNSLKQVFESDGILAIQSGLSYAQYLTKKYPNAKVQKVPYTGGITSFLNSKNFSQQCFLTSEPLLAEKAGIKTKVFLVSEEGFNPYTTVLATTSPRLKRDGPLVQAMTEAVRAGWAHYLANPEATNKHMNTLNKAMDLETFQKSALAQNPLIAEEGTPSTELGRMDEKRWQELITQLKELKILKKDLKATDAFRNF